MKWLFLSPFMVRPVFSYVLICLILTAQVGLPMHYHYCKGALESVSIFFKNACKEEIAIADAPGCCTKQERSHCKKENNGCCNDQVKVLSQDITSVAPVMVQLTDIQTESLHQAYHVLPTQDDAVFLGAFDIRGPNAKPPFYILHRSFLC